MLDNNDIKLRANKKIKIQKKIKTGTKLIDLKTPDSPSSEDKDKEVGLQIWPQGHGNTPKGV